MKSMNRRRALRLAGGAVVAATGLVAATAMTGSAEAATNWRSLVVITANIGRKNPSQRERAIRDVRKGVSVGGRLATPLVGWQEIRGADADDREPGWINEYFDSKYRNIFEYEDSPARQVPMSIPKTYDILDQRITFCHGGKARVSPSRYINQALLASADDPKLRFVFANTHYVAGAWNGEVDSHEKWRVDSWRKAFRKHRDDVLGYWRGRGFPVVWTGDVNRSPMPLLVPKHEKRAFSKGIDHIGWVPGTNGTQIKLIDTKTIRMHVDSHDARVAIMRIGRAS